MLCLLDYTVLFIKRLYRRYIFFLCYLCKFFYFRIINHVVKHGTSTANTFGSIAVIYSAFGVLLQFVRGTDDDLNTVVSATATGLLYKSAGEFFTLHCYLKPVV